MARGDPLALLVPYELHHLVAHLEDAGLTAEVHWLLALETGCGGNSWHAAKEAIGHIEGYADDVARAWRMVETAEPKSSVVDRIVLQVRYALMTASLESLSSNLPGALLAALARNRVWDFEQCVNHAHETLDSDKAIEQFTSLASCAPDRQTFESLIQAALRRVSDWTHLESFHLIAAQLDEQFISEAISIAERVRFNRSGYPTPPHPLASIVQRMIELNRVESAFECALRIPVEEGRSAAMRALVPDLSEELVARALTIAGREGESFRAGLLEALIPKLPLSLLPECLTLVPAPVYLAVRVHVSYAARMAELGRATAAIDHVRMIRDQWTRGQALASMAPHLSLPDVRAALAVAFCLDLDSDRWASIPHLCTRYAELATSSALDEVFSIDCQWLRAEVLVHLAPYLTGSLLLRAADAALKLEFERDHGYAVSALASRLVEEGEPNRALAFLETITYQLHLAEFLARSAGRLPPELLDCALALSRKLSFENDQKLALPVLFSELARRDRIEEAFEAVRQMKSQEVQSHVLCALATLLPSPLIAETIAIANRMERDDDRLRLLAAISTLALSSSQEDSVAGALESVIAGEREIYRHTDRLADAIGAMPMSMNKKVLAVLIRKLASDQGTDAWAHSTKRGWRRMIDKLATLAGPEQLTGLVGIARRLNDRRSLERCVALLVIALAEAGYSEPALLVALELADQRCRSDALAGIAAHAPPNLLSRLRMHAQELPEEFERPQALAAIAKRLCSICQHLEAMDVIRSAVWGMHREGVLSFMVRRLSSDLIPAAVELAKELHSPDGPKLLISLMAERPDVYSCQQIPLDRGVFLDILPPDRIRMLLLLIPPELLLDRLDSLVPASAEFFYWCNVMLRAAPHLPEHCLADAWERTCRREGTFDHKVAGLRGRTFGALACRIREAWGVGAALERVSALVCQRYRADALVAIGPHLTPDYVGRALALTVNLEFDQDRVLALVGLAPYLNGLIHEGWAIARAITSADYRDRAFAGLIPHLPEPLLRESLHLIDHPYALQQLAIRLWRSGSPDEAAKLLARIDDDLTLLRTDAMLELDLPEEALRIAPTNDRAFPWAETLRRIIPRLPTPRLHEVLERVCASSNRDAQSGLLIQLTHYLSGSLLGQAVERAIVNLAVLDPFRPGQRVHALDEIARHVRRSYPEVDVSRVHVGWSRGLHTLARQPRAEFVQDLDKMAIMIAATLPGEEAGRALFDTAETIRLAGRWWP